MNNTNSQVNYILYSYNLEDAKISQNHCLDKHNFDILKCVLCGCIPISPKTCSNCENLVCNRCVDNHLSNKSSLCPSLNCKQTFYEKNVNKLVLNLLNNLQVKCPNCSKVDKFIDLKDHIPLCRYTKRIAKCLGCERELLTTNELKEIYEHVEGCQYFSEACAICGELQMKKDMEVHYLSCPECTIKCPDCFEKFKRRDGHLLQHCFGNLKELCKVKNAKSKEILILVRAINKELNSFKALNVKLNQEIKILKGN
jgi:hypothetical protein